MNAPFLRPIGCPAGLSPRDWRGAVAARIEAHQDAVQALLAALDAMDGDADLEPSIVGGIEMREGKRTCVDDDREGGDVLDEGEPNDWDGEDNGDSEPSLGSPVPMSDGPPKGWGYAVMGGHGGDYED